MPRPFSQSTVVGVSPSQRGRFRLSLPNDVAAPPFGGRCALQVSPQREAQSFPSSARVVSARTLRSLRHASVNKKDDFIWRVFQAGISINKETRTDVADLCQILNDAK